MLRKTLLAGLAVCLCLFGAYFALWALGGILIISDPLAEADAAVILGGGDSTRVTEAIALYREGYVRQIILTETGIILPEWNTTYSNIVRQKLTEMGIPESAILITEHEVNSTDDEARAIRKLMNTRNIASVLVITDPYHSLRTRIIFRDKFKDSERLFYIHPVRNHWYRSNTWWQSVDGWQATLNEYFKLLMYSLGIQR